MLSLVDRSSFGDVLRHHLDPVLEPYGFASGQGDGPQVIFCAASDGLARLLPGLPWDDWGAAPGACTDVVVDGDGAGRVRQVRVDGTPVVDLLRENGRTVDAEALDGVLGSPAPTAAPVAARAFAALLAAAAGPAG